MNGPTIEEVPISSSWDMLVPLTHEDLVRLLQQADDYEEPEDTTRH